VAFVREAGLLLGEVLATVVSLLNPQVLMIGGDPMRAQEHFMVAVRERLYQRTQPLATRDLQIRTSTLGDRAGVIGAAHLVLDEVLSAESVDRRLAGPPPTAFIRFHAADEPDDSVIPGARRTRSDGDQFGARRNV